MNSHVHSPTSFDLRLLQCRQCKHLCRKLECRTFLKYLAMQTRNGILTQRERISVEREPFLGTRDAWRDTRHRSREYRSSCERLAKWHVFLSSIIPRNRPISSHKYFARQFFPWLYLKYARPCTSFHLFINERIPTRARTAVAGMSALPLLFVQQRLQRWSRIE